MKDRPFLFPKTPTVIQISVECGYRILLNKKPFFLRSSNDIIIEIFHRKAFVPQTLFHRQGDGLPRFPEDSRLDFPRRAFGKTLGGLLDISRPSTSTLLPVKFTTNRHMVFPGKKFQKRVVKISPPYIPSKNHQSRPSFIIHFIACISQVLCF